MLLFLLLQGRTTVGVDPGIFTFANHGCGGINNIGDSFNVTELTLDYDADPSVVFKEPYVNNLRETRQFPGWDALVALSDIHSDDEIFDNYLTYGGIEYFEESLYELKSLCSGLAKFGSVSQYENDKEVVLE
jgi:hypothetical protein